MAKNATYEGFTEEERAAMKARAAELKASAKRGSGAKKAEADLQDCLDTLAGMPDTERIIGETLHTIVGSTATDLAARTWYGMPAWTRDGKVVLFFKNASKFKMRYSEVGFLEPSNLDDGDMWPTVFAVTAMTSDVETRLTALVKQAVS